MKLINALLTHAWLAFSLRHHGEGLPGKLPAAFFLASLYVCLTLANKQLTGGVDIQTIAGLFFVTLCYLFGLRNHFIGLILLISVVHNALALGLATLGSIPPAFLQPLVLMEYIMISAAVINVVRRSAGVTEP